MHVCEQTSVSNQPSAIITDIKLNARLLVAADEPQLEA